MSAIYGNNVTEWIVKTINDERKFILRGMEANTAGFNNYVREGWKLGPVYINGELFPKEHVRKLPPYNPDKPLRFIFEFSDHNHPKDDYYRVLGFYVRFRDELHYENRMDWMHDESYLEFLDAMEEYGVHDIGFSPETDIFGVHSYEIPYTKEMEVMEKWRNFFIENDIICDDIIEFNIEDVQ